MGGYYTFEIFHATPDNLSNMFGGTFVSTYDVMWAYLLFPVLLRYFFIGEDEHKLECWKKCPLCFMMISSKDLYTIYIENVKQHCVSDIIEFMLLTRDKDSLTLNAKQKERVDAQEEISDSFSKFTFTSETCKKTVECVACLLGRWDGSRGTGMIGKGL
ncbi:hypothetical protein Tco_1366010 [Tanacetum coccineum]